MRDDWIGLRVARWRDIAGMTQQGLADRVGVSREYVSMIENGKRSKHDGYTTDVITDITLDWLQHKRDKSKPFMMKYHHKAPHRAWQPAPKYKHWLADTEVPEEHEGRSRTDRKKRHSARQQVDHRESPREGCATG